MRLTEAPSACRSPPQGTACRHLGVPTLSSMRLIRQSSTRPRRSSSRSSSSSRWTSSWVASLRRLVWYLMRLTNVIGKRILLPCSSSVQSKGGLRRKPLTGPRPPWFDAGAEIQTILGPGGGLAVRGRRLASAHASAACCRIGTPRGRSGCLVVAPPK